MKKKKVLFIFRRYDHIYVSIEKIFNAIGNALPEEFEYQRIEVPYSTNSIYSVIRNLLFLRKQRADIYHITGDIHYAVYALPRKRTVLTVHDNVFMYKNRGLKRWLMKKLFLKYPVQLAGIVTTVSEKTREEIINYTGLDSSKLLVVPNPILLSERRKDNEETDSPRLLFIGNTPNKNLDRVLEAIAGIKCTLLLLGKYPDHILHRMDDNHIDYRIFFGLSELELTDLYQTADFLIYPSLYEGFGLPILEAQFAGIPVLTSDLSPMREVADGAAILVDPKDVKSIRDGILKMISRGIVLDDLIQRGFQNVKKYQLVNIVALFTQIYRDIDGRKNGPQE
jgi:glycosyltransferase involved in cell wall biosynthesis